MFCLQIVTYKYCMPFYAFILFCHCTIILLYLPNFPTEFMKIPSYFQRCWIYPPLKWFTFSSFFNITQENHLGVPNLISQTTNPFLFFLATKRRANKIKLNFFSGCLREWPTVSLFWLGHHHRLGSPVGCISVPQYDSESWKLPSYTANDYGYRPATCT